MNLFVKVKRCSHRGFESNNLRSIRFDVHDIDFWIVLGSASVTGTVNLVLTVIPLGTVLGFAFQSDA